MILNVVCVKQLIRSKTEVMLNVIKPICCGLQIYENGQLLEGLVKNAMSTRNVDQYIGPPCPDSNGPCKNNGKCLPYLNDFICDCPSGFAGNTCEAAGEWGNFRQRRSVNYVNLCGRWVENIASI